MIYQPIYMYILPSLFYLLTFLSFYTFLKFKNLNVQKSFIYSYILSFISISTISKLILLFKIVTISKYLFFVFIIFEIIILIKFFKFLSQDTKKLKLFFGNAKNILLVFIASYLLIQSLILPPANFDSLAYHIQRNYLFINENTIYPFFNAHYGNQVFQALNSDLLFFFFAIFESNFFMNIFSIFSYLVIVVILFEILNVLNLKKDYIYTTLLMLLALSSITLSILSTKNDILIASFGLILIYLFYDYIKFNSKSSIVLFIISAIYAIGIKWNFAFFLFCVFPFFIFYIFKFKKFLEFFKISIILIPLILIIGPFEIIFFNLSHELGPIGPYDHVEGHTNPNGIIGLFSNLIRVTFSMFDITFPIHYFGFNFVNEYFNYSVNSLLQYLFDNTKLGISEQIKWLEYDYGYNLRPHSDYTGYSLVGFIISVLSFHYLLFGKNNILKVLSFLSFLNIIVLSYYLTWQPWILRYFMISMLINLIISTEYIKNIDIKNLKIINLFCLSIILFNVLTNVSQPLIKHSKTPSWLLAFTDREKYQSYSIPEMKKIKNFIKTVSPGKKVIIIVNREGSQTPYEILRTSKNNYFVFADKNLNRYIQKVYLKYELKIDAFKYDYILNISEENLQFENFNIIQNRNNSNFEIFKKIS